jgi:hypothetical protein
MTRTQSLNLDAIDYLAVRRVPKEESVPFAEREAVKAEAQNAGHRQTALTDAMQDAHLGAVQSKPDAAAAGQDPWALLVVRRR